jgi:hypothetical protein
MNELPSMVWSLRTTPSRATGFTPFFLVYGAEAILPIDLEYGSPRARAYDDQSNQTNREDSLDQLEEARDTALLHSARYQQSLRRYHARGVRSRDLQVGDLVLRLRQDDRGRHKLTSPWEGPFIIAKVLKPETYKMANSQDEVYNNTWNIQQATSLLPLRCFRVVCTPHSHTKSNHQGRVSLASAKTDPSSGARRGEPPLRQNFSRKKSSIKKTFASPGYISNRTPRNK